MENKIIANHFAAQLRRLRHGAFAHSADPDERAFDLNLLAALEAVCEETCLWLNQEVRWAVAQWGERVGRPDGQPSVDACRVGRTLPPFTPCAWREPHAGYGACPWPWAFLPVRTDTVALTTDDEEYGTVILTLPVEGTLTDLERFYGSMETCYLYLDLPSAQQSTDILDLFRDLRAASWTTKDGQPITVTAGLPPDPTWPIALTRLTTAFPLRDRFLGLPLTSLLAGWNDDGLTVRIHLGDADYAAAAIRTLAGCLRVNVAPLSNAVRLLATNYVPGTPLPAQFRSAPGAGLTVLHCAMNRLPPHATGGLDLLERRWHPEQDPSGQFDVVLDGDTLQIAPLRDLTDTTLRVEYLRGMTWSRLDRDALGITLEGAGYGALAFRLLDQTACPPLQLPEQLAHYVVNRAWPPAIVTCEDLYRAVIRWMPPTLATAVKAAGCHPEIANGFGLDPQGSGRATPITTVTLRVTDPEDARLRLQARRLERALVDVGLPLGASVQIRLQPAGSTDPQCLSTRPINEDNHHDQTDRYCGSRHAGNPQTSQ